MEFCRLKGGSVKSMLEVNGKTGRGTGSSGASAWQLVDEKEGHVPSTSGMGRNASLCGAGGVTANFRSDRFGHF
jgi:hypothetical protein